MFPHPARRVGKSIGFPRVRGDVPNREPQDLKSCGFSPRARGCSFSRPKSALKISVFPACAGMFRKKKPPRPAPCGFPRVRGDVPNPTSPTQTTALFSPRARGCSCWEMPARYIKIVFPACAGMFLGLSDRERKKVRFPRVRGDVPWNGTSLPRFFQFSPRARGCSAVYATGRGLLAVFPACAGMFRRQTARYHRP